MEKIRVNAKEHTINYSTLDAFWEAINKITIDCQLKYLLSHHEDGVIWGVHDSDWVLSERQNTSPQFNLITLIQCRFFGKSAELFIWRTQSGFSSRLLVEGEGTNFEFVDSQQVLWGDKSETYQEYFSLMREGEQGMDHLLPLSSAKPRAAIKTRAYIDYDDNKMAYFRWHRLFDLVSGIEPIDYRIEGIDGNN